ncbi:hypothetical protein UPYG_G00243410 [Umbra pygmaea]|uniref:TTF-type domain-containing protein n=1 Tax=Umbra pygmaea TaxID=75934 RepID=A0ABD0WL53_UMBPY
MNESFKNRPSLQYAGDRIHHTILALCEGTGSDNDSQNESEPDDFNPQSPKPPRPVSPDSAVSNDISQCLAEGSVQQSCPAPPGPDDISQSRADGPVQLVLKVFPKTQHGSRKRAFIETWYKDFTWLEYSVSRDFGFCYPCQHFFKLPSAPMSIFRSESGFSNWKKSTVQKWWL